MKRTKHEMSVVLLLLTVLLSTSTILATTSTITAAATTTAASQEDDVKKDDALERAVDPDRRIPNDDFPGSRPESRTAGLEKLYEMATTFIDSLVVPYTIGELIRDNDITEFEDFMDPVFYTEWRDWGKNYIGLAVTLVVGVLFVIVVPLIGFFFCMCRSCSCCGCCCSCCRVPKEGKTSTCTRVTCGFFLFSFTTLMLASGLCVFLTQDELVQELSPDGFFRDVTYSLDTLSKYVNTTMEDIEEIAIVGAANTIDDVMLTLETIPDYIIDALNNATQAEDLLITLEQFVDSLAPLATDLSVMVNSTEELKTLQVVLNASLGASSTSLNVTLQACIALGNQWEHNCTALMLEKVPLLKTDADFIIIDTTLAQGASQSIEVALQNGLVEMVDSAVDALNSISEIISNTTDDTITDIEGDLTRALDNLIAEWEDIKDDIRAMDVTGWKLKVEDMAVVVYDFMDQYYRWFYLGIVGIILAVTLFNYLGLGFGACCSKPKTSQRECASCTSAQGACFLLTGVALVFILGWLLMLVTLAYYVVGGGTEFLVCRHLVVYDDSMQELERLAFNSYDLPYNISVREVIDECRNNTALYTALRLDENGFNITDLLDLSDSGIYEQADKLKNISVDIGTIEIVSAELNNSMRTIDAALNTLNLDTYRAETDKDLVMTDVRELADELMVIATSLEQANETALARNFTAEAVALNSMFNESIVPMQTENGTLSSALDAADTVLRATNVDKLMDDLIQAQDDVNTQAPDIIAKSIDENTDLVLRDIEQFVNATEHSIIYELADCYPIYDTLKTVTYSTCIYFLYPFNSVWFCTGWFLFCAIFTLIFGSMMAGYYRQIPPPPPPMTMRRPPQQQAAQRPSRQEVEMQVYANAAYVPPDYDDDDDYVDPRADLRHPGAKKPPKVVTENRGPPPKYEEHMKQQILVANELNKQRKAEHKRKEKEAKEVQKKRQAEQEAQKKL